MQIGEPVVRMVSQQLSRVSFWSGCSMHQFTLKRLIDRYEKEKLYPFLSVYHHVKFLVNTNNCCLFLTCFVSQCLSSSSLTQLRLQQPGLAWSEPRVQGLHQTTVGVGSSAASKRLWGTEGPLVPGKALRHSCLVINRYALIWSDW